MNSGINEFLSLQQKVTPSRSNRKHYALHPVPMAGYGSWDNQNQILEVTLFYGLWQKHLHSTFHQVTMALTTGQWFAILPKIGGSISLIASSIVARDILKQAENANTIPITSAVILGKSIVCCIFSFFGPFLSTWMAPSGEAYYAFGTTTTCEIQGFAATFSIVSFVLYFVALVGLRKFMRLFFCHCICHY